MTSLSTVACLLGAVSARAGQGGLEAVPLKTPSQPSGATLFSPVSAESDGIQTTNDYADPTRTSNGYRDPRMWSDRFHEFEVGAIGTGVAVGDYDGDGLPDLFVVSKTESCRLFKNLGRWKFRDVTREAGVEDKAPDDLVWKQGAAFADVNNDGLLDLYVCRFAAPNLLYINQGDGTFKEEAKARGLALVDASVMANFCDYDRDGFLDVFVQTNLLDASQHPKGQPNHLFHNRGDGTFEEVSRVAGISGEAQGHSACWWDYDNDGWPDLYVANDFSGADVLYHNNRNGTFTDVLDRVVPHTPFSSMGSDLGDLNNDGLMDFMVADMAASTREKDQRTMAATRALNTDLPEGSTTAPQYPRNAVYLGTGTGRCLEVAELAGLQATDWTWAVRFEDLDNDGRLDLFVTNGMHREVHNTDLIERMMKAETPAEKIAIEKGSVVLEERHLAYRNLGDMKFQETGAAWGLDEKGVAFGAAFGDFDGDGDLDLVYTNYRKGVTLLRNDCVSGNRLVVALRGTRSNRFGVGARVTLHTKSGVQVRDLVLARGVLSTSEPILHFGLGDDSLIESLEVAWPSGVRQTFSNVPVNQRLTITENDAPKKQTSVALPAPLLKKVDEPSSLLFGTVEEPVDEFSLQRLLPFRQNRRGPAVAFGHAASGETLLAFGGTTKTPGVVLATRASASRPVSLHEGRTMAVNDGPELFVDVDGDGLEDLLVTGGGVAMPAGAQDYQPRLYWNRGDAGFEEAAAGVVPEYVESAGALAATDFNRDGLFDLFIGGRVVPGQYPRAPKSALWQNRGGRWEDVTETVAPLLERIGMVTGAAWRDVDRDGWPDLILTLEWGGVKVFHNDHGKALADWSERLGLTAAGTGLWSSLAVADVNGDGIPDLVVGNLGLNTPYRSPALLWSGDFKGDGTEVLLEGIVDSGKAYPLRSRKELAVALPSLLKRFPRNDSFARASLEEIIGAEKLSRADKYEAVELRSGVFLSQADGTYRFSPFSWEAQVAPVQGLAVADFNGDGKQDVILAQNLFSAAPSLGRFDGGLGLLLEGNGGGVFSAVTAPRSGFQISGDAKGLAVGDVNEDGLPDVAVTVNGGRAQVLLSVDGHKGSHFRIEVLGSSGWAPALGAKVSVIRKNGTVTRYEVHADSGYYGQSASSIFVSGFDETAPVRADVEWTDGKVSKIDLQSISSPIVVLRHP